MNHVLQKVLTDANARSKKAAKIAAYSKESFERWATK